MVYLGFLSPDLNMKLGIVPEAFLKYVLVVRVWGPDLNFEFCIVPETFPGELVIRYTGILGLHIDIKLVIVLMVCTI